MPIEAFVTQCLTSRRDACGLAAWAGNADAALCFPQAIDPAHCLSLVGEPMKNEVTPERGILSPAFGLQVASSGWPPKLKVGDTPKLIGENQERDDQQP